MKKQKIKKRVIILGGGPNRIGQGIEFDYCCCHASYALTEIGYESIIINSNPETVSTDYDTSTRLYFEPLTKEDVLNIIEKEKPYGVIVQLGGQTPLNLALDLKKQGVKILGTDPLNIDATEDRKKFSKILKKLKLNQAPSGTAFKFLDAKKIAKKIGYPVMVRPSYVLGGRAMEIVYTEKDLERYIKEASLVSPTHPILIDKFLEDAIELDVDMISDKKTFIIGGILEHIEEAGIHSGDSAMVLPPYSVGQEILNKVRNASCKLAKELKVQGLMNIQFAVKNNDIFVLEVNPRASRTIPFISKAIGIPLAKLATKVMVGMSLRNLKFTKEIIPTFVSVKESVFPFTRFPGADIVLGPEMRSTGEVMGIDADFGKAFLKSQIAAGQLLPKKGNIFISVQDKNKKSIIKIAKNLKNIGFNILSTKGTAKILKNNNIKVKIVNKIHEGRPHVIDLMKNNEIQLVINTPTGSVPQKDQALIRSTAIMHNIPLITTIPGAKATFYAINSMLKYDITVKSIQSYHKTEARIQNPE